MARCTHAATPYCSSARPGTAYNQLRLLAINNHRTVVGYETGPTTDTDVQQAIAQLADGMRLAVNAPVSDRQYTTPTAINNENVLTGNWSDLNNTNGTTSGFVAMVVTVSDEQCRLRI
jgi:autotransporter adhesin